MGEKWYNLDYEEIFKILNSNPSGLTKEEVSKRLKEYGLNELVKEKKRNYILMFFSQFSNFLILILLFASFISFLLNHIIDSLAILFILFINACFGFFQEFKAEKAVEALKKLSSPQATVIREGKKIKINANELVPGDVVFIEEGDVVPADIRLFEVYNLYIDESSLTGESNPVSKNVDTIIEEVITSDQRNMAFMGTYVNKGTAKGIVVETGINTEVGRIAKIITHTEDKETPLQKRINNLGRILGIIVLIIISIVFSLGIFFHSSSLTDMFFISVALAVSAIPEGLPVAITLVLAIGMRILANKKAIIRKLLAVETLGSTSIICTDKTGTLTKGEMTIVDVFVNKKHYSVTGVGYDPKGNILLDLKVINPLKEENFHNLLTCSVLCNNASLSFDKEWRIIGDPTEGALIVLAQKSGLDIEEVKKKYKLLVEYPFDSNRKRMSKVYQRGNKKISYVKGAPESILPLCTNYYENEKLKKMDKKSKAYFENIAKEMASKPLRVLALAIKEIDPKINLSERNAESKLTFIGFVGMMDPPREGVKEAIEKAQKAGIKTVMITGDHISTASAIANQLGIMKEGQLAITGLDLESMSDESLDDIIDKVCVCARVSPEHKVRILSSFQRKGYVVAMTGDGVNDAPALKKADIGVAMGIRGTEVSKEAADMILTDDQYATIINAVEYGRTLYSNIKKFLRLMLSANFSQVFLVGITSIFKLPLPLLPLQILWINLITDSFPALSLTAEPSEEDIMFKQPRKKTESLLEGIKAFISIVTFYLVVVEIILFLLYLNKGLDYARTIIFTFSLVYEAFILLNCKSENKLFFQTKIFSNKYMIISFLLMIALQIFAIYNPFMQVVFKTIPLAFYDWVIIFVLSFIILLIQPNIFKRI